MARPREKSRAAKASGTADFDALLRLAVRADDDPDVGEDEAAGREEAALRAFELAFASAAADPSTGVSNRSYFLRLAGRELSRARRSARAASVLVLQIDRFPDFLAAHGDETEDPVLKAVAEACAARLRETDLLGRFGRDRFAVLLPETPLAMAALVAERLRAAVASLRLEVGDGKAASLTSSIGIATADASEADLGRLLALAEAALGKARSAGRNSVVACC